MNLIFNQIQTMIFTCRYENVYAMKRINQLKCLIDFFFSLDHVKIVLRTHAYKQAKKKPT